MTDTIYEGYLIHHQSLGEGDSYYPYEVIAPGGQTVTWTHTKREAREAIDAALTTSNHHATEHTDRT